MTEKRDKGSRKKGGPLPRPVRVSKYLSLHLRHQPEHLGLELAPGGWVDVDTLLAACAAHGFPISPEDLEEVVTRLMERAPASPTSPPSPTSEQPR